MKIKDIMTREPATCSPTTTIAAAAALMRSAECGVLPVVDDHGRLAGVVTDRDLFFALSTRNKTASELTVSAAIHAPVVTCSPDDDVHAALATMKRYRVRRLPVEGFGGTIQGIVSMDDILLAAGGPLNEIRSDEIVETFRGIVAHLPAAPRLVH